MPVNSKHPTYHDQVDDWVTARTSIKGEKAIRANITVYLPVPPGMGTPQTVQHTHGHAFEVLDRYGWYATFAEFPEIVAPTVEAFQGLVHMKEPVVELPKEMEYLRDAATASGDTLAQLWKTVTRELISAGRQTLLGEVNPLVDNVVSCAYHAESLINWRVTGRARLSPVDLTVLEESTFRARADDEFEQDLVTQWRELRVADGAYKVRLWETKTSLSPSTVHNHGVTGAIHVHGSAAAASTGAPEKVAVDGADEEGFVTPMFRGKPFDFIPIDVGNASGPGLKFSHIPILPMSKRALSIFRRSADYNRALYNKGDPQAYIAADMDEDDLPDTIGGSELWLIPQGGIAGYLDIDGDGIPLMRQAIGDDYDRFVQEAGRFLETNDRVNPNESGKAVGLRLSAQRVTLRSLVVEAARLMEQHLRTLGRMLGIDEERLRKEISFKPNMDFTELRITGQELLQLVTAKNMGAPWSLEQMHARMREGGLTDLSFEAEMALIAAEQSLTGEPGPGGDVVLMTTTTDGHSHSYRPDESQTEESEGHAHPVNPDGTIGAANGHAHQPDPRAVDEA